MTCMDARHCE